MEQENINKIMYEFKTEVCDKSQDIDPEEDEDWSSLSLGYFLAKGLSIEEAQNLACEVRYTHHYWQNS